MAVVQRLLDKLAKEKLKHLEALQKPKDKTLYGFGELSGKVQGLSRAEQLVAELLEEEKNDESDRG